MFECILLDSILKLNGERTVYNIYHLLTAKKSTQTIQDSNLFGLTNYFGIYNSLTRQAFNQEIQRLEYHQLITVNPDQQTVHISERGKMYYKKLREEQADYFHLNGEKFHQKADRFSKNLLLFIQTLTHIHRKNPRFIPIIEDVESQQFVKKVWNKQHELGTATILKYLYQDLTMILENFPDDHAAAFVDSLTSLKKVGLSRYQIAKKYYITTHDVYLSFMNIIHAICKAIETEDNFRFLPQLYPVHQTNKLLSDSTNQTFYYLKQGLSIDEIANVRNLKENTIKDHIVEIAYIYQELNWPAYITEQDYRLIREILKKLESKKLKDIKSLLPDSISYFQIKLVIALEGRNNVEENQYV
ncbi:helix-turn-helix domain-containing protein [Gracilibacillus lacisalsi]|uniref:helix-turn-helix domain-containing protein n=1 Tax=Gracilibacillus lacisalsi TaxID=393087 RepID=UPI00035F057E|nr:helix-turn-helix domain-containing protein [Gracilibacillus lacisalsi]